MADLLDFSKPLDLNLLEQAVVAAQTASNNDQVRQTRGGRLAMGLQ